MRKALQFDICGHRLFGTLHDRNSTLDTKNQNNSRRIGVLLLSFGQQPRSWVGDLGSSIADRLDVHGYPAFRFDMPGLGDSPGEIPVHLEELWQDILLGAHEGPLHELCDVLASKYSLEGFVVGGFCGGAVTALFAINARSPLMLGLVLLEPEMAVVKIHSVTITRAPLTVDAYHESTDLVLKRLTSFDSWRRLFSGKADFKFWATHWYSLLDYTARKVNALGRNKINLPQETNHRMLSSWQLARRLRIPTLVVSVGSINRSKYYRAYGLEPGIADIKGKFKWIEIPNTTHAMLTGGAKDILGKEVVSWISATFPQKVTQSS